MGNMIAINKVAFSAGTQIHIHIATMRNNIMFDLNFNSLYITMLFAIL